MQYHTHDERFCESCDMNANIFEIFQSDCDVINHHLHVCYNFEHENEYKYFLPNTIRNNGYVKTDQIPHLDYNHEKKEYKVTTRKNYNKKRKKSYDASKK